MKVLAILLTLVTTACSAPATASASPSPSSSVSASTAAASGTAVPSAPPASSAASDPGRYGYVVASAGRITVRPERSTDAVLAIGGENPIASHDGRRFAFWRTGPQGNSGQELRIVEVPSGAERLVTTIAPGQGGGAIAWANDDTGLLYETHDIAQPSTPRPQAGPVSSTLIAFDLNATQAPGSTTSELMLSNGLVFIPLAWDKAGKIASALTTGEGGYAVHYYTWDMAVQAAGVSAVTRTQFPWQIIYASVQASTDAKRILAVDGAANVLRVWPIANIAAVGVVTPAGQLRDAKWRPGTRVADVGWVVDQNVAVFTYQTDTVGTIYRGQSPVGLLAWRADGSGLVVNEQSKGVFIVDLSSGETSALSGFGSVIAGAVLLR